MNNINYGSCERIGSEEDILDMKDEVASQPSRNTTSDLDRRRVESYSDMSSIVLRDFQPINCWETDKEGPVWVEENEPRYIIDKSTGRKYFNESHRIIRWKCCLLALGTPLVHVIASVVNIVFRSVKLITFFHFWSENGETHYNFKARVANAGRDLLRIVTTPLSLLGLELAAIYGVCRPHDGRKLYASLERGTYGGFVLAPCFQPKEPYGNITHLFGGDSNKKDAF